MLCPKLPFDLLLSVLGIIFLYAIIEEVICKVKMKNKVTAYFDSFESQSNMKVKKALSWVKYKYEIDGKTYFFETPNYGLEFENKNQPIKLRYDTKHPEDATPDSGYISIIIESIIVVIILVALFFMKVK